MFSLPTLFSAYPVKRKAWLCLFLEEQHSGCLQCSKMSIGAWNMKEATQIWCLCLASNTYTVVVNMYAVFNVTPPLILFCGISAATFLLGFVLQVEARLLIGNCCPSSEHSDALRAVSRSLGWQVTAGASASVADASPLSPVSSPYFSPNRSWPLTSPAPLWDQIRS